MDRFEAARPRLEAIAYRMLGSASEAEDTVQETCLRWQAADVERIEVPEAWLTKVLTNLCLNHLTSARARREKYVGQWPPEPLLSRPPSSSKSASADTSWGPGGTVTAPCAHRWNRTGEVNATSHNGMRA